MGKAPVALAVQDDPKALYDPDSYVKPSYLQDKFVPLSGAFIGFSSMLAYNYGFSRPLFAGRDRWIVLIYNLFFYIKFKSLSFSKFV